MNMIFEFLRSLLFSFGIAMLIALLFKSVHQFIKIRKMNNNNETSKSGISNESLKGNKTIIEFINTKISHELTISNSIKMTSSSFVGFSGIIFSIMVTTGLSHMMNIVSMRGKIIVDELSIIFWLIPLSSMLSGLVLIILPTLYAFLKIVPEYKNKNLTFREIIKNYHNSTEDKFMEKIEFNALEELENLETDNSSSSHELKRALLGFAIGIGLIFLTFLFGEGTLIDDWINDYYGIENT